MAEVRVNLPHGGYTIHIKPGCIDKTGEALANLKLTGKALVISDENVGALYGDRVLNSLLAAGIVAETICIPPGEDSKSLAVAMELYTKAITMGLDRRSSIIALGGGVVGDLAGFIAATYLRGVNFIQIPTTLLAQVDSSVGGKVAVNHPLGKNLIGAFYQPRIVLADTAVLATLPARELASGLAEVLKYGLISDAAFYDYLATNHAAILAKDESALSEIIRRSCQIKAEVVEQDEQEANLRMILNFGHTIGHAIEADTGYKLYNHGEAVAIGMHAAALLSHYLGLCSGDVVEAVRTLLKLFDLPMNVKECRPEALLSYLSRDKKSVDGAINWVLLEAVGRVTITTDVPGHIVKQVLAEIALG